MIGEVTSTAIGWLERVLALSGVEAHLRADRGSLRRLGVARIELAASGLRGLEALLQRPVDLVLCDDTLTDMSGLDFLQLIRLHPRLANLPVALVSVDNRREAVLQAKAAGCNGYVIRPYSQIGFVRQVESALAAARKGDAAGLGASEEAFARAAAKFVKRTPTDGAALLCDKGEASLGVGGFEAAGTAFRQALARNPEYAEAWRGLALAMKGRGKPGEFREAMRRAVDAFARQGRIAEAREAYAMLVKVDPAAGEAFQESLRVNLTRGNYKAAAKILAQAAHVMPEMAEVSRQASRACHFTGDPVSAARGLCRELGGQEGFPDPGELYAKIMGPPEIQSAGNKPVSAPKSASAGENVIPELRHPSAPLTAWRSLLSVAGHTYKVYRQGGVQGV